MNKKPDPGVGSESSNTHDELAQLLIKVPKGEKAAFQAWCKLSGVSLTEKLRELMTACVRGEGMGEEAAERLKAAKAAKRKALALLVNDAIAWPVGLVHEVFEEDISEGTYPATASYVDEVGNVFDEGMVLLTSNGEVDSRIGGGRLAWELTWEPAVRRGWVPSEEGLKDFATKTRWEHVKNRLKGAVLSQAECCGVVGEK